MTPTELEMRRRILSNIDVALDRVKARREIREILDRFERDDAKSLYCEMAFELFPEMFEGIPEIDESDPVGAVEPEARGAGKDGG